MKPIEPINWTWMKRNLHETGFEKLIETINLMIEQVNELESRIPNDLAKKPKKQGE